MSWGLSPNPAPLDRKHQLRWGRAALGSPIQQQSLRNWLCHFSGLSFSTQKVGTVSTSLLELRVGLVGYDAWHIVGTQAVLAGSVDLNTLCPTPRPLAGRCLPCKDTALASRAVSVRYGNSSVGTVGKARGACAHCQGSISVTQALTSSDLVFSPLTDRLPATAKLGDDLHWHPEKGLTSSPLIPTPTIPPPTTPRAPAWSTFCPTRQSHSFREGAGRTCMGPGASPRPAQGQAHRRYLGNVSSGEGFRVNE